MKDHLEELKCTLENIKQLAPKESNAALSIEEQKEDIFAEIDNAMQAEGLKKAEKPLIVVDA